MPATKTSPKPAAAPKKRQARKTAAAAAAPRAEKAAAPKPAAEQPKQLPAGPAEQPKLNQRVGDALADHGELEGSPTSTEGILAALTPEQRERALNPQPKAGLRGKALAGWILTGETPTAPRAKKAAAPAAEKGGPRPGGAKAAAVQVLRAYGGPMKNGEIAKLIIADKLAPGLAGKTPEQTISAMLQVEAKKPKGLFVKTEPGTFDLRELNPRGAKKRPGAKAEAAGEPAEQAAA